MGQPRLPMHGDDCPITLFIGTTRQRVSDNCVSFDIEPIVKDHERGYVGAKRDQYDQQLRGYSFKFMFDHADNILFIAWQDQIKARENNEPIPQMSISIDFEMTDGTVDTFVLSGSMIFKPSLSAKGSAEINELSIEGKCQEYDKSL